MATAVRHERYISVDIGYTAASDNPNLKGSNKEWRGTVFDDGTFLAEWGKVGGTLQSKSFPMGSVDAANREMDRKVAEKLQEKTDAKTGMKTRYERVNVIETKEDERPNRGVTRVASSELTSVAQRQIAHGDPVVADLVARLARENVHNIMASAGKQMQYDDTTGLFSTPMGVVTQDTIDAARTILAEAAGFVPRKRFTDPKYVDAVQRYMRKIPMDLGYDRVTPDMIFPTMDAVHKQGDTLDALEASLKLVADRAASAGVAVPIEVEEPKVFDVKLMLLDGAKELAKFRKLYRDTRKEQHVCAHLDVKRVFTVEIATMRTAFDAKGRPIGNVTQLWHGTRTANLLSILKGGLLLPSQTSAQVSGAMFGVGLYFANASTKSLNYSYGYWGGRGGYSDNCFMFLADVAMGKSHTPPSSGGRSLPSGYDSIWAKAHVSGVINDEIIVPRTHQCNLVYLLEFSPKGQ